MLLILCLSLSLFAQGGQESEDNTSGTIGLVTNDSITDQSINQAAYEACLDYAKDKGLKFTCYTSVDNTEETHIDCLEEAIFDCDIIVVVNFGPSIADYASWYPDIRFIAVL